MLEKRVILPLHPVTGLRAVGILPSGRVVWPIMGGDESPQNPVLVRLLVERDACVDFIDRTLNTAQEHNDGEGRDLVPTEVEQLGLQRDRISAIDAQIGPLQQFEELRSSSAETAARAYTGNRPDDNGGAGAGGGQQQQRNGGGRRLGGQPEPHKYRSAGEFIVDMIRARGNEAFRVEPSPDAAVRVASALSTRAVANNLTADVAGVLPEPIVGEILNDLDEARPFVESIGVKPLDNVPGKTFHRPVITQHTQVGVQTTEKTQLTSRKLIIGDVDFVKATYGGVVDVSRQTIDWSSPAAWDAIVQDLQYEYAAQTDDDAAAAFATAVTQAVEVASPSDLDAWITALYAGAAKAITGNGTQRASAMRMPNHIWVSVDRWATLGAMIDRLRMNPVQGVVGSSSVTDFRGTILQTERTVVPGLPSATVIIGRTNKTEFYEERIGLISAVEPALFGVEVAYGGYAAFGTLDPTAFVKITDLV